MHIVAHPNPVVGLDLEMSGLTPEQYQTIMEWAIKGRTPHQCHLTGNCSQLGWVRFTSYVNTASSLVDIVEAHIHSFPYITNGIKRLGYDDFTREELHTLVADSLIENSPYN